MKLIKVGAAVLNQTPLDWDGNLGRIERALDLARDDGVSILCLPELCIPGYGCDDFYQSPGVQETSLELLAELLPKTRGMVVSLGVPVQYRKALFNCVAVACDGELLGFAAKQHLAGDGLYYEPRWFKSWPERRVSEIRFQGAPAPIGDLVFGAGGVTLGLEICEEAWVSRRPGSSLAARGVDLVLNPSASHFAFGKQRIRRRFVLEGSRAFGVTYVFSNLLGNSSGRMIFDGGAMVATEGRLVAEGPRFSFEDVLLTSATVDVDATRLRQVRTGSFVPEFETHPGELAVGPGSFAFPDLERGQEAPRVEAGDEPAG
ncbi:MAG: nitrilase-related carbon-nitrogen hydrolase, partial [Acidobacteriota bacterium]